MRRGGDALLLAGPASTRADARKTFAERLCSVIYNVIRFHPPKAVKPSVLMPYFNALRLILGLTTGRCNHIATNRQPAVSLLSEVELLQA